MCKPFPEINAVAGSASEGLLVGLGAIPGAWLRLKVVNHFQPMVPKKHWGTFICLLYTSPSPRDKRQSRMPSSA